MMWFFIILFMFIGVVAGICFMAWRLGQTKCVQAIADDNKFLRRTISAGIIGLVFIISLLTMGLMNAMIVILHWLTFWLIIDGILVLWHKKHEKKHAYDGVALGILLFTVIYLSIGWYYAHHVYETKYQFASEKVDRGLRVVQITDSHIGATFHWQGFEKHMQEIQKVEPDILVVTGDFVDDDTSLTDMVECCRILGQVKTKYGVYFVFGNHDKGYYSSKRGYGGAELIAELEKNGVVVLQDEFVYINEQYCLLGRQDASEKTRASMETLMSKIDASMYTIVLDHQPTDYANQAKCQVDLVLSGHTHGGQLLPINYMGEWTGLNCQTYGLETRDKTNFIVSSGIADWAIKFRTGCIAEYVVITVGR